jgi:hypothetical protein
MRFGIPSADMVGKPRVWQPLSVAVWYVSLALYARYCIIVYTPASYYKRGSMASFGLLHPCLHILRSMLVMYSEAAACMRHNMCTAVSSDQFIPLHHYKCAFALPCMSSFSNERGSKGDVHI